MIFSTDRSLGLAQFKEIMSRTDETLTQHAKYNTSYYRGRNSILLEEDVVHAMRQNAKGTPFEGTIELISGSRFPDIVANGYFGVEVKSTNKNHWRSIGSSILESTRIENIEKIFLTFGKLGEPISFRTRPYEECLSGISVTHYPRYQIDMNLPKGGTIFDKMGIEYDCLRRLSNPISIVSDYYKKQLKNGQKLWWESDHGEEVTAPPILRIWNTLTSEEKREKTISSLVLFPEIIGSKSTDKYDRLALWLTTECSIVHPNIRDQFSAGGKFFVEIDSNKIFELPRVFKHILDLKEEIRSLLCKNSSDRTNKSREVLLDNDSLMKWIELASATDVPERTERIRYILNGIMKNCAKELSREDALNRGAVKVF